MSHYFIRLFLQRDPFIIHKHSRHGDLDVLLSAGGQVCAASHEVLLYALPAHRGQVHLRLLQPPLDALVAARDLEAATKHLQHRPDVDVGQGVLLWTPAVNAGAARDVKMSS